MDLKPNDRVLLLTMPSIEEVRRIASCVSEGIVVGVLHREEVYEARRLLRDEMNVMITPADPGGVLPWRDDFFSVVYAPLLEEPSSEVLRVLVPGGTAWLAGGPVTRP